MRILRRLCIRMNKTAYQVTNIIVLLAALAIFAYGYRSEALGMTRYQVGYLVILFAVVVIVNIIKAVRFYFILAGDASITRGEFIKQYCKTVPVSVLLPFKSGELFRIFCYGHQITNMFMGIVYVILDRFFDTIALLVLIGIITFTTGQQLSIIAVILIAFVLLALILFFVFPKICEYWKRYLLVKKASESTLRYLKTVSTVEKVCNKIQDVIRGKGSIVFFMSFVAWMTELFGAYIIDRLYIGRADSGFFENYLLSAIGTRTSSQLDAFVIGTIVVLIIVYVLMYVCGIMLGKKHSETEDFDEISLSDAIVNRINGGVK